MSNQFNNSDDDSFHTSEGRERRNRPLLDHTEPADQAAVYRIPYRRFKYDVKNYYTPVKKSNYATLIRECRLNVLSDLSTEPALAAAYDYMDLDTLSEAPYLIGCYKQPSQHSSKTSSTSSSGARAADDGHTYNDDESGDNGEQTPNEANTRLRLVAYSEGLCLFHDKDSNELYESKLEKCYCYIDTENNDALLIFAGLRWDGGADDPLYFGSGDEFLRSSGTVSVGDLYIGNYSLIARLLYYDEARYFWIEGVPEVFSDNDSSISDKVDGRSARAHLRESVDKTMGMGVFRQYAKRACEKLGVPLGFVSEDYYSFNKRTHRGLFFPDRPDRVKEFLKDTKNRENFVPPAYYADATLRALTEQFANKTQRYHFDAWKSGNAEVVQLDDVMRAYLYTSPTSKPYKGAETMRRNHEQLMRQWNMEDLIPQALPTVLQGTHGGSIYDYNIGNMFLSLSEFLSIVSDELNMRTSQNLTKFVFKLAALIQPCEDSETPDNMDDNIDEGRYREKTIVLAELTVDYTASCIVYLHPHTNLLVKKPAAIGNFKEFYALYSTFFDMRDANALANQVHEPTTDTYSSSNSKIDKAYEITDFLGLKITVINSHHFIGGTSNEGTSDDKAFIRGIASTFGGLTITFAKISSADDFKSPVKDVYRATFSNGLKLVFESSVNVGNCIASALRISRRFTTAFISHYEYTQQVATIAMINSKLKEHDSRNPFTIENIIPFVKKVTDNSVKTALFDGSLRLYQTSHEDCDSYDLMIMVKDNHAIFIEELPTDAEEDDDEEVFGSPSDLQCYFDLETVNVRTLLQGAHIGETTPYAIGFMFANKDFEYVFSEKPERHTLAHILLDKILVYAKEYLEINTLRKKSLSIYLRAYNGSAFDFISVVNSWLFHDRIKHVNFPGMNPEGSMKYWKFRVERVAVGAKQYNIHLIFTDPKNFISQDKKDLETVAKRYARMYPELFPNGYTEKLDYDHNLQQQRFNDTGVVENDIGEYLERDVKLLKSVCLSVDKQFRDAYKFRSIAAFAYRELVSMSEKSCPQDARTKCQNCAKRYACVKCNTRMRDASHKHPDCKDCRNCVDDYGYMFHANAELNAILRQTVLAGRCQYTQTGDIRGSITYNDNNSLYPYVAIVSDFPTPFVEEWYNKKSTNTTSDEMKVAITKCLRERRIFAVRMKLVYSARGLEMPVVLPPMERDEGEDQSIRWDKRMEEGWVLSNQLMMMLDFSILEYSQCVILELVVMGKARVQPFRDYMEKYRLMKESAPNGSAERATAKDMSNNVLGKTVQRAHDNEWKYIEEHTILDGLHYDVVVERDGLQTRATRTLFADETTGTLRRRLIRDTRPLHRLGYFKSRHPDRAPLHLGVFIYSYAREHMYRTGYSKVPRFLYTDTDSILFFSVDDDKMMRLIDPRTYGMFKTEYHITRLIISDRKEYYFEYMEEGVPGWQYRFKGLDKGYIKEYQIITTQGVKRNLPLLTQDDYRQLFLNKLSPDVAAIRVKTREFRNQLGLKFYIGYKYYKGDVQKYERISWE
jgi:hypothetical protein